MIDRTIALVLVAGTRPGDRGAAARLAQALIDQGLLVEDACAFAEFAIDEMLRKPDSCDRLTLAQMARLRFVQNLALSVGGGA